MPSDQTQPLIVAPTFAPPLGVIDGIMQEIEPELTSEGRKTLDVKYQNETPEQLRQRNERYQKALEEFDRRYLQYVTSQTSAVTTFVTTLRNRAESADREREADIFTRLDAAISNAPDTHLAV